jgi:hypothetical protein
MKCSWCQARIKRIRGVRKVARLSSKQVDITFCNEQEANLWARSCGGRFQGWVRGVRLTTLLWAVGVGLFLGWYVNSAG